MKDTKYPSSILLIFIVTALGFLLYVNPSQPLMPSLQTPLRFPHLIGVIAYPAILFSLFITVFASIKGQRKIPSISLLLQIIALSSFIVTMVSGMYWASWAWGSYWLWDPKQTWSLIFLVTLVFGYSFAQKHRDDIYSMLPVVSLQIFAMTFLLASNSALHYYSSAFDFMANMLQELVLQLKLRDYWSSNSSLLPIFIILVILEVIGLLPAYMAHRKGHNFVYWLIYGGILFPIAILHIFLLKPDYLRLDNVQIDSGMKKCPHCAEFVRREATVCRYCSTPING